MPQPTFNYKEIAQQIFDDLNLKPKTARVESIKTFIQLRFLNQDVTPSIFLPTLTHHIDYELSKQKITSKQFIEGTPPENLSASLEAKAIVSGNKGVTKEEMVGYISSILNSTGEQVNSALQIAGLLLFSVGITLHDVADAGTRKALSYLFPQRERLPRSYDGYDLISPRAYSNSSPIRPQA